MISAYLCSGCLLVWAFAISQLEHTWAGSLNHRKSSPDLRFNVYIRTSENSDDHSNNDDVDILKDNYPLYPRKTNSKLELKDYKYIIQKLLEKKLLEQKNEPLYSTNSQSSVTRDLEITRNQQGENWPKPTPSDKWQSTLGINDSQLSTDSSKSRNIIPKRQSPFPTARNYPYFFNSSTTPTRSTDTPLLRSLMHSQRKQDQSIDEQNVDQLQNTFDAILLESTSHTPTTTYDHENTDLDASASPTTLPNSDIDSSASVSTSPSESFEQSQSYTSTVPVKRSFIQLTRDCTDYEARKCMHAVKCLHVNYFRINICICKRYYTGDRCDEFTYESYMMG